MGFYNSFWGNYENILGHYTSNQITTSESLKRLKELSELINNANGDGIEKTNNDGKYLSPKELVQEIMYVQFLLSHYDFNEVYSQSDKISESIIIDESTKIQRILYDIYTNNSNLLTLNCWEFEEIVAELLSKQGYKVELTQKTKDNGYDIIALMNIKMHNPLKFLVQCKRYARLKVGVDVIRSFKEVIDTEKANRGIIVTTSYFTQGALKKQCEIPYLLDYRDKDRVIDWVRGCKVNCVRVLK